MADITVYGTRVGGSQPVAQRYIDVGGGFFAPEVAISAPAARPLPVSQASRTVLAAAALSVAVAGFTADLDLSLVEELAVDCSLTTLVAGAAPTVQFILERKMAAGPLYVAVWTSAALSAVGVASTSVGAGMPVAAAVGSVGRLRWAVVGAPTSATADLSITGK